MTGLLVSVRNADEARLAVAGGADLIDVKEPNRGSLGPADPNTWRQVVAAVDSACPVSVALGELLHDDITQPAPQLAGVHFAKVALAGCGEKSDWPDLLRRALEALPSHVARVAVAYADHICANAPPPRDVWSAARHLNCKAVLFDTFAKSNGNLLDHLSHPTLSELCCEIRSIGLQVVLAGSLDQYAIDSVLPLRPDFVAVRGAVCRADRTGSLDPSLVEQLAGAVREGRNRSSSDHTD